LEDESQFAAFKISGYRPDAQIEVNLAIGMEMALKTGPLLPGFHHGLEGM
jgi:hypothetical protein